MSGLERAVHVGLDDQVERGGLAGLDLAGRCPRAWRRRSWPWASRPMDGHPRPVLAGLGDLARPSSRRGRRRSGRRRSATSDRPRTCTGVDGPASLTCLPWSSMSARTRPQAAPATSGSPTLSVPCCTRIVATGPRPMSRLDSSTTPRARPSGLARRSSSSATHEERSRAGRRCRGSAGRRPRPRSVSPPQDSGTSPCSESCCMTRLGSAFSRSILLMATTIGTSAALAWLMRLDGLGHDAVVGRHHEDDDVGGLGATGPHGGERLVAGGVDEGERPAVLDDLVGADVLGDAAGLAGDHVGVADLVEELGLAVVDVAHDGDDRRADRPGLVDLVIVLVVDVEQLLSSSTSCSSPGSTRRISAPISAAKSSIMSSVSDWVAVTISPCCMRKRTTSAAVRFSLGPSSWGVEAALDHDRRRRGPGRRAGCSVGGVHRLQLVAVATATTLAALRATGATRATGTTATGTAGTTAGATTGTAGTTTGAATGTAATGTTGGTGTAAAHGTAGAAAGTAGTTGTGATRTTGGTTGRRAAHARRGRDRLAGRARSAGARAGAGWACPTGPTGGPAGRAAATGPRWPGSAGSGSAGRAGASARSRGGGRLAARAREPGRAAPDAACGPLAARRRR